MVSGEQLLEQAAKDGSMDPNEWPRALELVLSKLEHIVHNEFPIPTAPPPEPSRMRSTTPTKPEHAGASSQDSQSADKENAPPHGAATPSPRPSTQALSSGDSQVDGDISTASEPGIPPELHQLYTSISATLSKNFPRHPPHTIQRLAELILQPKTHYRFLPSFLCALDRVVSVSSTTTVFPLPQAVLPASTGILNGVTPSSSISSSASLGSDESLGGALLTPIPWLRPGGHEGNGGGANGASNQSELVSESTEMVDGPNGAGRIETVSVVNGVLGSTTAASPSPSPDNLRDVGAVTQGELLRQEQEAGVVPVAQSNMRNRGLLSGAAEANSEEKEDEPSEEHPHARGPEEIGMEDMGPQERGIGGAINLEAAVGRPAAKPDEAGEEKEKVEEGKEEGKEEEKEEEMKDADESAESARKEKGENTEEVEGKDEAGGEEAKTDAEMTG